MGKPSQNVDAAHQTLKQIQSRLGEWISNCTFHSVFLQGMISIDMVCEL